MIRPLIVSKHPWIGIGLFVVYWVSAAIIPDGHTLLVTNCMLLICAFAVAIVFIREAYRCIRDTRAKRIQHMIIGTAYIASFAALWGSWNLFLHTSGYQSADVNNDISAFLRAGIALGFFYLLTSPGVVASDYVRRGSAVAVVVLLGLFLAGVILWVRPDTSGFMAAIRPYIPR